MPPRRSRNTLSSESTPRRSSRRANSAEPLPEATPTPIASKEDVVDAQDDEIALDIKEPEDEEYHEEPKEDEEEEDDAYSGEDDEDVKDVVKSTRRKSQRSSSRSKKPREQDDDDDDEEDDEDLDDGSDLGPEDEETGVEVEEEEEESQDPVTKKLKTNSGTSTPVRVGRRGPGRGKKGPMQFNQTPTPVEDLRPLEMKDDEYILTDDEEGETKITPKGELQGGRQFRVRTFTVHGKGDRLYMLSTEPARCMGFRDSYLLFQKHRRLYKVVLSSDEKFDLINRDIIPHSYKGRVIGLVTARSIFKEFGAKIIVGGRNITDDYYAKRLREKGEVVEGELAEPEDAVPPKGTPYNQNQFVAWHGASSVYHSSGVNVVHHPQPLESLELKSMKALKSANHINEENWMYQHAVAVRDFEKGLLQGRQVLAKGLRDPYTGVLFVPELTQPNHLKVNKIIDPKTENNGEKKRLIYETIVRSNSLIKCTGLKDVPLNVFEGVVDEEIKQAILRQQEYEKSI